MRKIALVFILLFSLIPFTSVAQGVSHDQLIIINKAINRLAFYEDGKLVKIYKVATGRERTLTPEGKFQIVTKIVNRPYYKEHIPGGDPRNPLGDRWMGLNALGTYGTTYGIHGNNRPSSIGKYASSGCVRMYHDEIHSLYSKVQLYTPVIITYTNDNFDTIASKNGYFVESKINKIDIVKPSPSNQNKAVTITAKIANGYATMYKFYILDRSKWVTLRDYSTSPTFTWKPVKAGTYQIKVQVKSKNSKKIFDDEKVISYLYFESASLKTINLDKVSPQQNNTNIIISAQSNKNQDNLFQFSLFDGKKWTVLKKYSTISTFNWKPNTPGSYKIKVQAKHKLSKSVEDDSKVINYLIYQPAKLDTITPDIGPFTIDTPVEITANANGGNETQYRFDILQGTQWITLQNYSNLNSYNWNTPSEPGIYKIRVLVKNKNSKKEYDDFKELTYTVQ